MLSRLETLYQELMDILEPPDQYLIREIIEAAKLDLTHTFIEHPDNYDGPCECQACVQLGERITT